MEMSLLSSRDRGSSKRRWPRLAQATAVVSLLVLVCSGSPAQGEVIRGVLSGRITDASGGALPGATVAIANADGSITATVVTDSSGNYVKDGLPVGTGYRAEAEYRICPVAQAGDRIAAPCESADVADRDPRRGSHVLQREAEPGWHRALDRQVDRLRLEFRATRVERTIGSIEVDIAVIREVEAAGRWRYLARHRQDRAAGARRSAIGPTGDRADRQGRAQHDGAGRLLRIPVPMHEVPLQR